MQNTKEKIKYSVGMEDHWDFYKDPPLRSVIGEFDTYEEALVCAKSRVVKFLDSLEHDPACIFISPEPDGEHFDSHAYEDELRKLAEGFVKSIPGTRKGTDMPAYQHSYNVRQILRETNFKGVIWNDEAVNMAGFLHDVVEDGGIELDQIEVFGERVRDLVDLCSHDESVLNGDARWVKMISRLVDANDAEAWAIKLADVLDNVRSSVTMNPERAWFIKNVKARLLLNLTKDFACLIELREKLEKEII